jgi:cardiolipin synthase (CMP-forming)
MTLANLITISRIALIPCFALAILYYSQGVNRGGAHEWEYLLALIIFAVICISDGVDGYVARKFNQQTRLGSILDPLADKTLLLTSLLILSWNHGNAFDQLPLWFPIVVISRDAMLVLGVAVVFMMGRSLEVKPHWTGKIATVFQMATVGLVLLRFPQEIWGPPVWIAGAFTVISGAIYVTQGMKRLSL